MENILEKYATVTDDQVNVWFSVGKTTDFPTDGGACIKYKDKQIAVYNFTRRGEWYACQNACPHKMEMVLSRGMTGSADDIPKIACPMHKKTFSLVDGSNLNGADFKIATYPVKVVEDAGVFGERVVERILAKYRELEVGDLEVDVAECVEGLHADLPAAAMHQWGRRRRQSAGYPAPSC